MTDFSKYRFAGPAFSQLLRDTRSQESKDLHTAYVVGFGTTLLAMTGTAAPATLQLIPLGVMLGVTMYESIRFIPPDAGVSNIVNMSYKDPVGRALRQARHSNTLAQLSAATGLTSTLIMAAETPDLSSKIKTDFAVGGSLLLAAVATACAVRSMKTRHNLNKLIKQHNQKPLCQPL